MASSTQFSIRGLMVIAVVVAIISAAVGPGIQHLEPQGQLRAALYLSLVGVVTGAVTAGMCARRRRIEKLAGRLLSHTSLGGAALRWTSLAATIPLAISAAYVVIALAPIDLVPYGLEFVGIVGLISFMLACTAAGLFLHWWWGTGFLAAEAFENGLVVRGLVLLPWSDLVSYERATLFLVNVSTRCGVRPVRFRVAVKDRADWERILAEHGVSRTICPAKPNGMHPHCM